MAEKIQEFIKGFFTQYRLNIISSSIIQYYPEIGALASCLFMATSIALALSIHVFSSNVTYKTRLNAVNIIRQNHDPINSQDYPNYTNAILFNYDKRKDKVNSYVIDFMNKYSIHVNRNHFGTQAVPWSFDPSRTSSPSPFVSTNYNILFESAKALTFVSKFIVDSNTALFKNFDGYHLKAPEYTLKFIEETKFLHYPSSELDKFKAVYVVGLNGEIAYRSPIISNFRSSISEKPFPTYRFPYYVAYHLNGPANSKEVRKPIYVTRPYIDYAGMGLLKTYSTILYDSDNLPFAILCIDVPFVIDDLISSRVKDKLKENRYALASNKLYNYGYFYLDESPRYENVLMRRQHKKFVDLRSKVVVTSIESSDRPVEVSIDRTSALVSVAEDNDGKRVAIAVWPDATREWKIYAMSFLLFLSIVTSTGILLFTLYSINNHNEKVDKSVVIRSLPLGILAVRELDPHPDDAVIKQSNQYTEYALGTRLHNGRRTLNINFLSLIEDYVYVEDGDPSDFKFNRIKAADYYHDVRIAARRTTRYYAIARRTRFVLLLNAAPLLLKASNVGVESYGTLEIVTNEKVKAKILQMP